MNRTDSTTLWACLCAGDILLRREGGTLSLPVGDEPPVTLKPWNLVTTLSIEADTSICQPLPSVTGGDGGESVMNSFLKVVRLDRPVTNVNGLEMMNLRASFDVLDDTSYALAGKSAELIYWDQNTRYCGCCGAPMKMATDISKRCTECGKEVWPQLATAVIVRITREATSPCPSPSGHPVKDTTSLLTKEGQCGGSPSILLVHAHNFRRPYYGLVAGFVETGESLEEAVCREVREETGLEIQDIRYFGSQPWPYPCGLMVGFTARYASGELRLQRSELSAGGWFTRDTMPPIPGRSSIARRLIDDWLNPK